MADAADSPTGAQRFPATRHTLVGDLSSDDRGIRERAWSDLVTAYWKPTYAYLRFAGRRSPEECEDLVQSFFARAMEKDYFRPFDSGKARFRTFLRTCLDAFAMNADRARFAQKRDARMTRSLDFADAETDFTRSPAGAAADPSAAFDLEWVRQVLAGAVEDLRLFCEANDRRRDFEIFRRYDLAKDGDPRPTYADLARLLNTDVTTITNRLFAARRELRRCVLEKIRRLTATDDEYRDEVRAVLGIDP